MIDENVLSNLFPFHFHITGYWQVKPELMACHTFDVSEASNTQLKS